jgi:hypothetical protein
MPGYRPFASTGAAVEQVTRLLCSTVGTLGPGPGPHPDLVSALFVGGCSSAVMQTAGTATSSTAAAAPVRTGVHTACGGDAPEWIYHEEDAFAIKCGLADDILARLVREAYAECCAVLGKGRGRVRRESANDVLALMHDGESQALALPASAAAGGALTYEQ